MKSKLFKDTQILVESEGGAPTAFRIWKAGENMTDHGAVIFSKKSADLLMTQQEQRGNLFSIDYDHLSLKDDRPGPAGEAAGWHRLEVRQSPDGPELWAVDVQWCKTAKEGLEEDPPKWRYFSPAYYVNPDNNEVESYVNLALCINPATWNVTQLATIKLSNISNKSNMEELLKSLMGFLTAVVEGEASDDLKKMAGELMYSLEEAIGSESPDSERPAMDAEDEEEKKEDAEGEDEEMKADAEDEDKPMKSDTRKSSKAELKLATRIAELEARLASQEVSKLVEKNLGVKIPRSLESWARSCDMDTLKAYLKKAPMLKAEKDAKKDSVSIPRGKSEGDVDPVTAAKIDKILSIYKPAEKLGFEKNSQGTGFKFNTMLPSEIRKLKK